MDASGASFVPMARQAPTVATDFRPYAFCTSVGCRYAASGPKTELTAVAPVTAINDALWGKPPGPRKG